MRTAMSLDGIWSLCGFKQGSAEVFAPSELGTVKDAIRLDAKVPGEAQLTLSENGIIPKDIFMGMNIREAEKYETYEWWYEREFTAPALAKDERLFIKFGGVDCIAEYFLNDEMFAMSENAMIAHEFEITDIVKPGENKIAVRLRSPIVEANEEEYPLFETAFKGLNSESAHIRRPAHSYGWDIMPRAVTSGLWRSVELIVKEKIEIRQLYLVTTNASDSSAMLTCLYDIECPAITADDDYKLSVKGVCGESVFSFEAHTFHHNAGRVYNIYVPNPKLWWPHGYGEPNLYDITADLYHNGEKVAEKKFTTGIRTAKLIRTEITDGLNGCFKFNVNGVDIMAKGSNWVPLDVFHSRDLERVDRGMEMIADLECNIVRCWGGNVYESERFYDLCDRYGVMVWQDFGLACHYPPQDEVFAIKLREEVAAVVKERRHHPCIVLWAGDNEVDQMLEHDPLPTPAKVNRVNREVIPNELYRHDRARSYLASSPYYSDEVANSPKSDYATAPENHIWGPRDYFKSRFYTENAAHFISETGYHGCPGRKSVEKFITKDKVWGYHDNEEWILHSADQQGNPNRMMIMDKQIRQLFGEVPDNLDDFATASQYSQAEAKKFLLERMRAGKPTKSGIIWWNLLDGWPQFSDAIVDYYFEKKLAYNYIKRSQKPFFMMIDEIESWNVTVVASNDTRREVNGEYRVFELKNGELCDVVKGRFGTAANANSRLAKIPVMYSDKRMFIIAWKTSDGEYGYNHYLAGMPPFDLKTYTEWMKIVDSFDAKTAFERA